MKTTLFVLLTALTLTACVQDEKQPTAATSESNTILAQADQPAPRVHHRMQLEPVTADKFKLARKD